MECLIWISVLMLTCFIAGGIFGPKLWEKVKARFVKK